MERLGRDVLAVLDGLGITKINWCGLSMGGMVGQWLGANAPEPRQQARPLQHVLLFPRQERLERPPQAGARKGRRRHSRRPIWSAGSPKDSANATRKRWRACKTMFAATALDGYLGCGEAVRDMDHRALLPKISAPTLVIAGKHDPATPLEGNEYIQRAYSGRQARGARGRASRQCRAAAGLYRHRARVFVAQFVAGLSVTNPDSHRGRIWLGRNKYQSRENRARVRELLMREWDPIGVADASRSGG